MPGKLDVAQVRRLAHDILARKIVAGLFEHLHQRGRRVVAEDEARPAHVLTRQIFAHPGAPILQPRIILKGRVERVLHVGRGQQPDAALEPRRLEDNGYRG